MLVSGAEMQQLFGRGERRTVGWLIIVGTGAPCSGVLASVAFDAGIISSKFYTTLVIAAVLTSQFAGAWLDYVMRKGLPLLRSAAATDALGEPREANPGFARRR